MASDSDSSHYVASGTTPSSEPPPLSMPAEEKARRWGRQFIRDCMVDYAFSKRDREIEYREMILMG